MVTIAAVNNTVDAPDKSVDVAATVAGGNGVSTVTATLSGPSSAQVTVTVSATADASRGGIDGNPVRAQNVSRTCSHCVFGRKNASNRPKFLRAVDGEVAGLDLVTHLEEQCAFPASAVGHTPLWRMSGYSAAGAKSTGASGRQAAASRRAVCRGDLRQTARAGAQPGSGSASGSRPGGRLPRRASIGSCTSGSGSISSGGMLGGRGATIAEDRAGDREAHAAPGAETGRGPRHRKQCRGAHREPGAAGDDAAGGLPLEPQLLGGRPWSRPARALRTFRSSQSAFARKVVEGLSLSASGFTPNCR